MENYIKNKTNFLLKSLKDNEEYAGLVIGTDCTPDYHLIVNKQQETLNFFNAQEFASHLGYQLPKVKDLLIIAANQNIKTDKYGYYWSCEFLNEEPFGFQPQTKLIKTFCFSSFKFCAKNQNEKQKTLLVRKIYTEEINFN